MRELPHANISEDFYMWFDLEEKKEYYATPLYLYQVKRDRINPSDETKLYLKLKKDISKVKTGKDKESKTIQKDFEQWKKEAKDKITKMKKNKLTEDEIYKWLVENK